MKLTTLPTLLATACLVSLAPSLLAQSGSLLPGELRGYAVSAPGPGAPSHTRLVVGDFSGDLRADAALLTHQGISFSLGIAGFG